MFLYLVRHAEAKSKEEDPERSLSEKGLGNVRKTASYLSGLDMRLDTIFHSGKRRAAQTAEALAEALAPPKGVSQADGLSPLDNPEIWADRLTGITDDIMLVGHLPYMERLASLLLSGNTDAISVNFGPASVICLQKAEDRTWALQWMMTSETVR